MHGTFLTAKSIFFANASCFVSLHSSNSGTTTLPIIFPTEVLIFADCTAGFAEKKENQSHPENEQDKKQHPLSVLPCHKHLYLQRFLIASTTSSILISELSINTASSACLNGAVSRFISLVSRSSISRAISSSYTPVLCLTAPDIFCSPLSARLQSSIL